MADINASAAPVIVYDTSSRIKYLQGKFLGKGGFAKCYEFKNLTTTEIYAGKVVPKSLLCKPQHKAKMFQEIAIHRSLAHQYIVKFFSHFEDDSNVYIVLELCRKRSLMEMHKRRKALTLPEVRYFMRQIVTACKYLHDKNVIHRDLKLGNLFINDDMVVKVGDFGLATVVAHEGERKKTLCGTPNYIAPEILTKKGHSFEVDIWSLGCIMYTLLIGAPPFETESLKNTYSKIKKNEYLLPKRIDLDAQSLIKKMLNSEPKCRPTPDEILADSFLTKSTIPSRLPTSCLTMQPRFSNQQSQLQNVSSSKPVVKATPLLENVKSRGTHVSDKRALAVQSLKKKQPEHRNVPSDYFVKQLLRQLVSVTKYNLKEMYNGQIEDAQDPASVPFVWISKWVDYTDKYGLGYQLCDNSFGILFNDSTHLILLADGENFHYKERQGPESYHQLENCPVELNKKVTLLKYFLTYMQNNLVKAGDNITPREGDEFTQVPHLNFWYCSNSAMIFHLSNGTLQLNFFQDHTKLIICPVMGAVSYIDEKKEFLTYKMELIEKYGCHAALADRLQYAKTMIEKISASSIEGGKVKVAD